MHRKNTMNKKEYIEQQLSSFGYENDDSLPLPEQVIKFLNWINHRDDSPEIVRNVQHVDLMEIHVDNIIGIVRRLRQVQPHAIPEGGIAGIVIQKGEVYSLLDGYHRYVWMQQHNQESGLYIVLS